MGDQLGAFPFSIKGRIYMSYIRNIHRSARIRLFNYLSYDCHATEILKRLDVTEYFVPFCALRRI